MLCCPGREERPVSARVEPSWGSFSSCSSFTVNRPWSPWRRREGPFADRCGNTPLSTLPAGSSADRAPAAPLSASTTLLVLGSLFPRAAPANGSMERSLRPFPERRAAPLSFKTTRRPGRNFLRMTCSLRPFLFVLLPSLSLRRRPAPCLPPPASSSVIPHSISPSASQAHLTHCSVSLTEDVNQHKWHQERSKEIRRGEGQDGSGPRRACDACIVPVHGGSPVAADFTSGDQSKRSCWWKPSFRRGILTGIQCLQGAGSPW